MKINFSEPLFLIVLLLPLLTACGLADPSTRETEAVLAKRIERDSAGRMRLVSFERKNGQRGEIGGIPFHTVEFTAGIEVLEDCKWLTSGLGGERDGFKTTATVEQAEAASGFWGKFMNMSQTPGTDHRKGQRLGIYGKVMFEKSENGWRPTDRLEVATLPKNMTLTPVVAAVGDKATQRIGSGESRENWSLSKAGAITFEHQSVANAIDPLAAELRISNASQKSTLRYAVLVDTDKGPMEGFVWRTGAKSILARIPVPIVSDTVFWSPDGAYAVVTDAGEVQDHVYVVDLQEGRVTKKQVGAPFKVGDCELKQLHGQPASWLGNSSFQVKVRIVGNVRDSRCSDVKPRSLTVDIPLS